MVRGWDLAITEKQSADYTAGALCGWNGELLYIVDVFRRQWAWAKVRAAIISQSRADRAERGIMRIGIEGVSGFDAIYQDVKQELLGETKVIKSNPPRGGKLLRAQPWLNLIEAGRVVLVRGAWNKDFLAELDTFPDGAHDDQVDGVSICHHLLVGSPKKYLIA